MRRFRWRPLESYPSGGPKNYALEVRTLFQFSVKIYIIFYIFRGGTSNMLFLCSLPASVKKIANGATYNAKGFSDPATPNEVLLRIYFNPNTAHHVVEESVVFTLLAERKLGPKLYGVFGDGRVEEYIHSRSLETPEIRMPVVSAKIARILAQIHQLTMPVEKTPTYLRDSMRK